MTNAFKCIVWLLLNNKCDITLNLVVNLLSLTLKNNCIAIFHSFFHIYFEYFLLINKTMVTSVTMFLKSLALAITLGAMLLHIHLHKAHIDHLVDNSSALTLGTHFQFSTFSTCAFAMFTIHFSFNTNWWMSSQVQFFERSFDCDLVIGTLLTMISSLFDTLKRFFALLIINLAFLFIA